MFDPELRCRRCGAPVSEHADRFAHVLAFHSADESSAVLLVMCRPCGSGFATIRDRDEYARLVYFG